MAIVFVGRESLSHYLLKTRKLIERWWGWGGVCIAQLERVLALYPAAPGSILVVPNNFSLHVAEIY